MGRRANDGSGASTPGVSRGAPSLFARTRIDPHVGVGEQCWRGSEIRSISETAALWSTYGKAR